MLGIYTKLAAIAILAIALAGAVWKIRHDSIVLGRAEVQAKWDTETAKRVAEALAASERARATELALQTKVRKVTNDYQLEKSRRAAADGAAADSLRKLQAAITGSGAAGSNTATSVRTDDPRDAIIGECAGAVRALGEDIGRMAAKITGLQDYAGLCVIPAK